MTKELQSHLSEPEKLKGLRIVMTDDEKPLFLGLSYQPKTSDEEKALAWMFRTAAAIVCGVAALVLWRVAGG
jgi:hypothetical protein